MTSAVSLIPDRFVDATEMTPLHFRNATLSTFADNTRLPVHRWFRYSAGFSAHWARHIILQHLSEGYTRLLEPFAGSGTALLEAQYCGLESVGLESHPFVVRVAQAKLNWDVPTEPLQELATKIVQRAAKLPHIEGNHPELILNCFPPETLQRLFSLKISLDESQTEEPYRQLAWLALVSIIRECSPVGTAQWQYVLPNKTKAKTLDPFFAFDKKIAIFIQDMTSKQRDGAKAATHLLQSDARTCEGVQEAWADFVLTSPPYANNYDYADATRLEMSFMGEIGGWGDLQQTIRKFLVRSCSQQVSKEAGQMEHLYQSSFLSPIAHELIPICRRLGEERLLHGGKKNYHAMIASYFEDMAQVWLGLRRSTRQGARVCFVIGDSAPYGVHIPVERWFGELALASGFKSWHFEKLRDRNTKWKNRKHSVPLQEGLLWVEG